MPDYIGNIPVPEITPSGTFPLTPDYPVEMRRDYEVAVHQFGSGNAKIEQRFLIGTGARRWIVHKRVVRDSERIALRNFWESKYGPYGAFTFNAPREDGSGTDPVIVRFANEPLTWEMVADWACSLGVTLIEIPQSTPSYTLNQTVNRFPPAALKTALLSQVQEIIPLIRIQPLEPGYPEIYVSDRRCIIGGQLYQARLVQFDGISQSIGAETDEARFVFGNADRVMRDLANDTDLYRAQISFSLYHVGTGIRLDLWSGNITNWSSDSGPEFEVTAADGLYELNLPYPTRRISRSCWKQFKGPGCPYSGPHESCDKGFDTPNGCRSHGMDNYFGGIIAKPQGVRIKDNSTGVWGFGRSTLTSVSLIADSIYDQVVPEIYTDSAMPVNAKIAMGRDESDFYAAVGIVGEGPLGAYGAGHKLDGQPHHGYPGPLGLLENLGPDPNSTPFGFDTDAPVIAERAAGTAFVMIRRTDSKGLQLSRLSEHAMEVVVAQGLGGWKWTAPGNRTWQSALTNPIWIAVNMVMRARGLRAGQNLTAQQLDFAETLFDVDAAIAAAAICDEQVAKLIGSGNETQFKFRGILQEEKPLRDWLQEVLMNCLGYYTFANGKLKFGVRVNSSSAEAFTEGNILFRSLQLAPLRPGFNHLTANFADEDYQYVANSISLYDIDHANLIGGGAGPLFLKSTVNLAGTASKSQAARIITTRLREELGGIARTEWERARQISFKTTVLALNTEPGMVCSLTHPDMPGAAGEFRVTGWRLNGDYSIDVQGRTTTDSMYDMLVGPKPQDVQPDPVPQEQIPEIPIKNLTMVLTSLDDETQQVTIKLSGTAPQLEGLSHFRCYVEIPQETDPDPRSPTLPGQLFYTGNHYAEPNSPVQIELVLPYPPLQWLNTLPDKHVMWIIYVATSTWREDAPLVRLTQLSPPQPVGATPYATVELDFASWVNQQSLQPMDPVIEESLTQIEAVGDDVRIRLAYHPVWPSLDLAAVHLYSSTEAEPDNLPHGRFPYEGVGQTLPEAYGYAVARVRKPATLPAKVALQIAGEWANGETRKPQRVEWVNGTPQNVPSGWGTVVEVTAESLSLGEPQIAEASVEYREAEGGWAYRMAFTLAGAVISQPQYRGADVYVRFADEPEPATDDGWYALRQVASHEPGAPATVYSPWYPIRPGTSAQFYARPVARGEGGARRWGALSGPHSISLGLGSVLPGAGHNFQFSATLAGYWDDGNGVRLGKVDVAWTPLSRSDVIYTIWECRMSAPVTPSYSSYQRTEANTSESSLTMWVAPPKDDTEYLYLALTVDVPADGIWPSPTDYASGTLPVASVTLPVAGLSDQVSDFAVTVETDQTQDVPRGRFVFAFTPPSDPDYHHVHIYRRPANSGGAPIADWLPDKVASIIEGGPGGWWTLPSQPEYWIFRAVACNSLGQENLANPPEVFVAVPTSAGVTASKAAPGMVTGPLSVNVNNQVTIGPGAIGAEHIGSVDASVITGPIVANQIQSINANQINGLIAANQIAAINADQINGLIQASQIASVNASQINGQITASQIQSITADKIAGQISASQISSVNATQINGVISAGQIGSVSASSITGVIVTQQLADSILASARLLASSFAVPIKVSTLPALPSADWPVGSLALRTTDRKLFKNVNNNWVEVSASTELTGALTASDITSINASSIVGLITAGQIQSINSSQISGLIQSSQIQSISADKITGTISASQIGSVNASSITGQISSSQIQSVSADKITGTITSDKISSINANQITGTIIANQIDTVYAYQIVSNSPTASIVNLFVTGYIDVRSNPFNPASGTVYCGAVSAGSWGVNLYGHAIFQSGQSYSWLLVGSPNVELTPSGGTLAINGTTLGNAAFKNIGTGSNDVAAGNHTHSGYSSSTHIHNVSVTLNVQTSTIQYKDWNDQLQSMTVVTGVSVASVTCGTPN